MASSLPSPLQRGQGRDPGFVFWVAHNFVVKREKPGSTVTCGGRRETESGQGFDGE